MVKESQIKKIPCVCENKNCKVELKIIDMEDGNVKIQIFNSKDIDSVVVNKLKLKKSLEIINRIQCDTNYIQIINLIPKNMTILDLGCGNGRPFIGTDFPFITGVDIWKKKFYMPEYDEICFNDIREIDNLFPEKFFDVVTAIDVIEHLEKEEGLKLIEDAEKLALKKVIFFTPRKWDENKDSFKNKKWWSYENKYCLHKSIWTEEDFTSRGYEIMPLSHPNYILAQKVMK